MTDENQNQSQDTENTESQNTENQEEKKFTQSEIDSIIQDRLARQKRKHDEELEAIRNNAELPEGETDWKAVYEDLTAEYNDMLKKSKLTDAGFSMDEVEKYTRYITAETAEEIEQEAHALAGDVLKGKPKQYADPGQSKKKGVWKPFG